MNPTHPISEAFFNDLRDGCLQPLLAAIKSDDTLLLGLRGSYVSIYYRGGELLTLGPSQDGYRAHFNPDYDPQGVLPARLDRHGDAARLERLIRVCDDAQKLVDVFHELKRLMDVHPKIRSSHEREFQQLIARESNRIRCAGESAYFITDIEHTHRDPQSKKVARFDMLGVRWLARERKHGDRLRPVLFEVKYGGDALEGKAGLVKHLEDLEGRLRDDAFVQQLRANIAGQFNQLAELELLEFNRSDGIHTFMLTDEPPEVVLVLAGYNPRSRTLREVLAQLDRFDKLFKLRFFQATFAGYAMHDCAMLKLADFRALVEKLGAKG